MHMQLGMHIIISIIMLALRAEVIWRVSFLQC